MVSYPLTCLFVSVDIYLTSFAFLLLTIAERKKHVKPSLARYKAFEFDESVRNFKILTNTNIVVSCVFWACPGDSTINIYFPFQLEKIRFAIIKRRRGSN